jgi:hypothetical protein
VHNIATRGFDRLLKYVLELETPGRRVSMVNACTKGVDGSEKSVYEAVVEKLRELNERIRINRYTEDRRIKEFLVDTGNRLQRCKHLLVQAGAVANPSITVCSQVPRVCLGGALPVLILFGQKRWRISG